MPQAPRRKAMEKKLTTSSHSPRVEQILKAMNEWFLLELTAPSPETLTARLRAKQVQENERKNNNA